MYDYNTGREPMKLRQFGRNVQNLAKHVSALESREERNKYSEALVELMKQIVPNAKANQESNQFLWDDLHILTNNELEVDGPFPKPELGNKGRKPDRVAYNKGNIRFRHYGKNVMSLIEETKKIEDPEVKEAAVIHLARLMKSFHMTWNREMPDDSLIAKNIKILSDDDLELNLEKATELELLDPLYKEKPRPTNTNKTNNKGGGKNQNRRRKK
jgi:hypothetical protein